jgi:hypothetical protein
VDRTPAGRLTGLTESTIPPGVFDTTDGAVEGWRRPLCEHSETALAFPITRLRWARIALCCRHDHRRRASGPPSTPRSGGHRLRGGCRRAPQQSIQRGRP